MTAVERCDHEIAEAERLLLDGHPEVEGLALAISDWSREKRMIERAAYEEFLASKRVICEPSGFIVDERGLNIHLKDFQHDIVKWACRRGKAALWAECGLGKTLMQLDWARLVCQHTGGKVLIFAPLAVAEQTVHEGEKFGIPVTLARTQADCGPTISITNYEMLEHFDPSQFVGLVVDESGILKGWNRKTKQRLVEFASGMDYRLACTATPAPNDYMEFGSHSEFLGIMSRAEMLATFFTHDGGDTAKWRLKGHAQDKFWEWMAKWAVVMRKPSDLGYCDDGYLLLDLKMHQHTVAAEWSSEHLFPVEAKSLTERRAARRDTLDDRVAECARIVNSVPNEQWLIWCNLNSEQDALQRIFGDRCVSIQGSDDYEDKISREAEWRAGKVPILISKPSIFGHGLNWQHCAYMAFVGLSDSFEQLYQALRRCWRFGQLRPVNAHIITSELEGAVVRNIERKERQYEEMGKRMVAHMKDLNAAAVHGGTVRTVEQYTRETMQSGSNPPAWIMHLGDCVEVLREMPSREVGFIVYSPPFSSLYTYSNSERDMGNCPDDKTFEAHYRYLVQELFRVLQPGRLCSFHCMNLPTTVERDGFTGIRDFRGKLIKIHEEAGFIYHSEVCIWKDPLVAMQRTHAKGLLHVEHVKDSACSRQGLPDYLVTMRKPGINQEPISHLPSGWTEFVGEDEPKAEWHDDPSRNKYSHHVWQRYASPVWTDINPSDTLQRESVREDKDERHIAPLQLQVIERAVLLWSNPRDVVLSPFAGIGSEGYVAVKRGRRFIGAELKRSYYQQACKNLMAAEQMAEQAALPLFVPETGNA